MQLYQTLPSLWVGVWYLTHVLFTGCEKLWTKMVLS